jgi:hypothetical protein
MQPFKNTALNDDAMSEDPDHSLLEPSFFSGALSGSVLAESSLFNTDGATDNDLDFLARTLSQMDDHSPELSGHRSWPFDPNAVNDMEMLTDGSSRPQTSSLSAPPRQFQHNVEWDDGDPMSHDCMWDGPGHPEGAFTDRNLAHLFQQAQYQSCIGESSSSNSGNQAPDSDRQGRATIAMTLNNKMTYKGTLVVEDVQIHTLNRIMDILVRTQTKVNMNLSNSEE